MIQVKKSSPIAIAFLLLPALLIAQEPAKENALPTATEAVPTDEKLDPETQRLIQESREKIIKERAERLAAEKRAAEEETKRKEEEKSKPRKDTVESRFYVGGIGSLGLSVNSFHRTGFTAGATIDGVFQKHIGMHFGFATGTFKTKGSTLSAENAVLTVSSGETIGFIEFHLGLSYVFNKIFDLEPALGGGIMIHQLGTKTFGFGNIIAPMLYTSVHYPVIPFIEIGIFTQLALPFSSTITAGSTNYALSEKQSLVTVNFMFSVRLLVH